MRAGESASPSPPTRRLQSGEVHDLEEVRRAFGELTKADLGHLHVAAKSLLGGFRIDPGRRDHRELLSAAVSRTLSGERRWHKGVDLRRHLFRTMRSIASHWRREAARPVELESLEDHPDLLDPRTDPEARLIARETVAAIRKHFEDDMAARAVIACMAYGMKGPEIRRHTGMTQRQLATTVERIRRYARRRNYEDAQRTAQPGTRAREARPRS